MYTCFKFSLLYCFNKHCKLPWAHGYIRKAVNKSKESINQYVYISGFNYSRSTRLLSYLLCSWFHCIKFPSSLCLFIYLYSPCLLLIGVPYFVFCFSWLYHSSVFINAVLTGKCITRIVLLCLNDINQGLLPYWDSN